MAFSPAFLDELNQRNPIEDVVGQYVALTRRGSNLFGLCPFHGEKTASFSVAPEKGIFYCFGCHKGGGVINFIMDIENLSYPDAVRFLAKRAGLEVPDDNLENSQYKKKERLWALCKSAARFFNEQLKTPAAAEARAYAQKRGLSPSTITRFGLGFAPNAWTTLLDAMVSKGYTKQELLDAGLVLQNRDKGTFYDRFRNRLMFPIIDVRGNVIGFGGRVMDDSTPKYLNSPETLIFNKRRNLFGMNIVKKSKQGYIILTEGYMDAIALHQYGFDCAVASLGTSLTPEQARLISRYTNEVVLCYDSDEAGKKAASRGIGILEKLDLKVRVLQVPGAKDPDEFIKKNGADAFRNLIDASAGQIEYRLRDVEAKNPPTTDEGRVDYLKSAASLLASLPGAVEREVYAARVAEKAGVSREAVLQEAERLRRRRIADAKKREARDAARPTQTAQPAQRSIRYDDPRSARAEEGLIRILYLDPGAAKGKTLPPPESFSSPVLARLYRELLRRVQTGETISMAVLAGQFTGDEMSHFTSVLGAPEDLSHADKAISDYIAVITGRTEDAEDDLRALAEKYRKTKSFGG